MSKEGQGGKGRAVPGPVWAYLVVWALSLAAFWLPGDASGSFALGYSLVFIWGVLPVTTFVASLLVSWRGVWGRRAWLLAPALGLAFMLLCWLTFPLANTLAFGRVNAPEPSSWVQGTVVSLAGLATGALARLARRRGR